MFPSIKMGSCFVRLQFTFILAAILFTNCEAQNYGGEGHVSCHEHERDALIKFRSKLMYNSDHQIASWDQTSGDCCQWRGVVCDNQTGYVLELDLFPYSLHVWDWYDHQLYENLHMSEISGLSGQLDPVLLKLENLRSLDLSGNLFTDLSIPPFLGSFENLRYLNLSNSRFAGQIPQQLGNLSTLERLDFEESLYNDSKYLSTSSLHWLRGMPKLKSLNMNYVNLSQVGKDWIQLLNKTFLPSLYELDLSHCRLREIDITVTSINFNSIQRLNLAGNEFDTKIPSWITNISSLEYIDLGYNMFHGVIPHDDFAELPQLKYLSLEYNGDGLTADSAKLFKGAWSSIDSLNFGRNNISGELGLSICNLTSLVSLDLSDNKIHGLPETITEPSSATLGKGWACLPKLQVLKLNRNNIESGMPNWLGNLSYLQDLDMSNCDLSGRMPTSLGDLSSLRILNLDNNRLSGIIPENVWNLSGLEKILLGGNSLTGQIEQLNQLKKLTYLDLSPNSNIVLHLPSNWVPPFQLEFLDLETCSLGPRFPQWIANQTSLRTLAISNSFIEDNLPPWFWEFASSLDWLDLSHNKIKGLLPKTWNFSSNMFNFDISNNQFLGPLPRTYLAPLPAFFSISGNNISGTIPNSICDRRSDLTDYDLSQNHLVGNIPQELGNCSRLSYLVLSENHLSAELPWSLSKLDVLILLMLGKNKLSGSIPVSLRNCSYLQILDLGENALSGNLSPLVHIKRLSILLLQSNMFTGALPFNMSSMVHLQILNLFNNQLSGYIPKSIGKLAALTTTMRNMYYYGFEFDGVQGTAEVARRAEVWMSFKGQDLLYDKNLHLVSGIDLSRNHFHGEIPKELMKLEGLVFLNLSHNNLTGMIPENIGELIRLESLDISNNQLEGEIPSSLSQLTFLIMLNLSNNHLQGRIPLGGQLQILGNRSSYEGNVGLCGLPLQNQCTNDTVRATPDLEHEKREDESELILFLGMMFGFVIGFWAFWGFLIVSKLKRIALYKFYDKIMDKLLLLIVVCLAKIQAKT